MVKWPGREFHNSPLSSAKAKNEIYIHYLFMSSERVQELHYFTGLMTTSQVKAGVAAT
jgi:hypothetical protein